MSKYNEETITKLKEIYKICIVCDEMIFKKTIRNTNKKN